MAIAREAASENQRRVTILLVDDIPANLTALEAVLEPLGDTLVKMTSGEEALRYLLHHDIALVLLDVHMPVLDGFETAKLIKGRRRSQHVPILFVTATDREEASIVKGYAHGALDYILKPFQPEVLFHKVRAILRQQQKDELLREEQHARLAHAEFARMEAEQRLGLATEAAGLGVWDWALEAKVLTCDARTKAIFGLPPDAPTTYERILQLIRPADRARVDQAIQRCLDPQVRGEYRIDYACLWPSDGSEHWVEARGMVIFDADGKPMRFVGTVLEITDRKRIEEAREQFIAILGHDLRNPLAAIKVSTEILIRSPLTEGQTKAAHRIGATSGRMGRMIQELLDFARTRLGGTFPITRQPIRFGEVAQAATEELVLAHPDRRIEYREVGDLQGEWDGDRVVQVVSNLVGNAVRHGQDPIRVEVRGQGATVMLSVGNQGPPIPPELLPHVFEPFRSGADADRHGLGLGLFIVRQIVRAHGGEIEAVSSLEEGTVFRATLPRGG
jgi:sigma-B regulation protein RsbU (phosphoserine phosphatase)